MSLVLDCPRPPIPSILFPCLVMKSVTVKVWRATVPSNHTSHVRTPESRYGKDESRKCKTECAQKPEVPLLQGWPLAAVRELGLGKGSLFLNECGLLGLCCCSQRYSGCQASTSILSQEPGNFPFQNEPTNQPRAVCVGLAGLELCLSPEQCCFCLTRTRLEPITEQ